MISRLLPGELALILGAVLIVLLAVPFIAVSYRRRGGMTGMRSLAWAAVAVYAIALWTYTLLPLPEPGYQCVQAVLDPLASVRDVRTAPHRGIELLSNGPLQQLVFNVVFFLPLGFLLRMITGRGVFTALALGFTVSLAIELTQLTGIWGLHPCAYRFFDVSDLITNSGGAVLGSLLALTVPGIGRRIRRRPLAADEVTLPRRLLGMFSDALAAVVSVIALAVLLQASRRYGLGQSSELVAAAGDDSLRVATVVTLAWGLAVVVATGATLGEHAVLLATRNRWPGAVLWRTARFALGVGGLTALFFFGGGLLPVTAWALVLVVSVALDPRREGLALRLTGTSLGAGRDASAADAGR